MTSLPYPAALNKALAGFQESGPTHHNCAQTMIFFAALRLGSPVEVTQIARYLGGGIVRQGLTCGVLTGTALALALGGSQLESDEDAARTTSGQQDLQSLISDFVTEFGASDCATLTGCNLLTPEGSEKFRESGAGQRCEAMVRWMMERLDQVLQKRV